MIFERFKEILAEGKAIVARDFLEALDDGERSLLLTGARQATDDVFGKTLRTYVPGDSFPAISVTGSQCELQCAHCSTKYLNHMVPATTPDVLEEVLRALATRGGKGALVSGGSMRDGTVPLPPYYPVLRRIKETTSLSINVHVGMISSETASSLKETHIDTISLDLVGDDDTAREIYGLDAGAREYEGLLKDLLDAGFTNKEIVPHICLGLRWGKISGEYGTLDLVRRLMEPRLIVFIVMIPPADERFSSLAPRDAVNVIATARALFPTTELSLGCMRPGGRKRVEMDMGAFKAGINRVALPTRALRTKVMREGYRLIRIDSCCSLEDISL